MSYIVVLNPLVIYRQGRIRTHPRYRTRRGCDRAGCRRDDHPHGCYRQAALRHGGLPGRECAARLHHCHHPEPDLGRHHGIVVLAGLIMTVLVLTGFRTAVFEAVPESLKTAIVVGIGFFISFIGLVDSGIIRRMPDAAGTTVPVSLGAGGHLLGYHPRLPLLLFFTIALFIRNVKGAILWGVLASTALSLILEAVVPSGSVKESATGWSLNVPSWRT